MRTRRRFFVYMVMVMLTLFFKPQQIDRDKLSQGPHNALVQSNEKAINQRSTDHLHQKMTRTLASITDKNKAQHEETKIQNTQIEENLRQMFSTYGNSSSMKIIKNFEGTPFKFTKIILPQLARTDISILNFSNDLSRALDLPKDIRFKISPASSTPTVNTVVVNQYIENSFGQSFEVLNGHLKMFINRQTNEVFEIHNRLSGYLEKHIRPELTQQQSLEILAEKVDLKTYAVEINQTPMAFINSNGLAEVVTSVRVLSEALPYRFYIGHHSKDIVWKEFDRIY